MELFHESRRLVALSARDTLLWLWRMSKNCRLMVAALPLRKLWAIWAFHSSSLVFIVDEA